MLHDASKKLKTKKQNNNPPPKKKTKNKESVRNRQGQEAPKESWQTNVMYPGGDPGKDKGHQGKTEEIWIKSGLKKEAK